MSRGATLGSGTMSYGRWRIIAHSPDDRIAFLISSAERAGPAFSSEEAAFPLTLINSMWRRSPRCTSSTVPDTGDARQISPDALSMSRVSPAATVSPAFTAAFQIGPGKSSGHTAKRVVAVSSVTREEGMPATGMSRPFFIRIFSAINNK